MHNVLRRILVADDDHDTADLTTDLLRLAGHEVRTVYDGRQAVATARTFRPHLVILDIEMPEMDGCQAAAALRANPANANLILVAHTALTLPDDLHRILRSGFDRYLVKPVGHGALEALVAKFLLVPAFV